MSNNDNAEKQYLRILHRLTKAPALSEPVKEVRGHKTYSLFGAQIRHRFQHTGLEHYTLPLLTTKEVHLPSVLHELLWFISGDTNVEYLHKHNVRIWDEWADEDGNLGPVYGSQWRSWPDYSYPETSREAVDALGVPRPYGCIDQLENVMHQLKHTPNSRRMVVSAWNVSQLDEMALPPCHLLFQFYVNNGKVSLQVYQRSADWFLGVPFNLTSYAVLTLMAAKVAGLTPHECVYTFGDYHLYTDHLPQAKEQLSRKPNYSKAPVGTITGSPESIDGIKYEDILITNYQPYPAIKAKVNV